MSLKMKAAVIAKDETNTNTNLQHLIFTNTLALLIRCCQIWGREGEAALQTTSFYLPLYPTPSWLLGGEWGGLGWWRCELEQVKGTASCCSVKSECWSSSWVPTHVVRALQREALGLVRRNRAGRAAEVGAVRCSGVSRWVGVLQPKYTEKHQ